MTEAKFKAGDKVQFRLEYKTYDGVIRNIDRYGTVDFPNEPNYDILVESENCIFQHIREGLIVKNQILMSEEKNTKVVYDYLHRSDVIGKQICDTLDYMYSIARPLPDKSFMEMCKEIEEERKAANGDENWRKDYCNGRYLFPCDFFYVPFEVQKAVRENRQEAYGIEYHWDEDMKSLIEFLYTGGGLNEVCTPTEWSRGENVRHCEPVETIDKIIGEEAAQKLKEVLEGYHRTYRWGLREVNQFMSLVWSAPSTNRKNVVKAWKESFGIDIKLPDDKDWVDIYDESEYDDVVTEETAPETTDTSTEE
jgi:hypothetical protein